MRHLVHDVACKLSWKHEIAGFGCSMKYFQHGTWLMLGKF
jgi:hypothetical protein